MSRDDINLASSQSLVERGFSETVAAALRAGRPYFSLADVTSTVVLDDDDKARLRRWYMVTPLDFDAHGAARPCSLRPAAKWVTRDELAPTDTERAPARHDYQRAKRRPRRDQPGRHTFPAYRDQDGALRYLDPQFVALQARRDPDDPELAALLRALNLRVERRLPAPGLFIARLGGARHGPAAVLGAVAALRDSPLIELVEPAWLGFDDLTPVQAAPARQALDVEEAGAPWNLALLRADALWQLGKGDPAVLLACVDTGIDAAHPALAANDGADRTALDFSGDGATGGAEDENGHGTGVAGMMVGSGGLQPAGLAPRCSLVSMKVQLQTDVASYASRRAALLALVDMAGAGRRLVVNLSWKTTGDVALIRSAIEALAAAGAIVVCSAGNDGSRDGAAHYPSDYRQAMSVAATDEAGALAGYSNAGPAVDLAAPGGSTTAPLRCCAPGGQDAYLIGTSFAAPQIAAAAALVWSARPEWSAEQVRAAVLAACGPGLAMPDLARLASQLTPAKPASGSDPEPNPRPASTAITWPIAGAELVAKGAGCPLASITRRILSARTAVSGWDEVAAVLGMDGARLACLRAALETHA